MRRRKVTYRPSRANGVMGLVLGGVFVLIGLFVAIPFFGIIGVVWTLFAAAITAYSGYLAFGKKYIGPEIHIEDEDAVSGGDGSAEARLTELRALYDRGLITAEEYEKKREEILAGL